MFSKWLSRAGFCLVLAACGVFSNNAFAQFLSGVEATVVDTTGAVIPKAEVEITNQATSVTQKAVTNGAGYIRILQLPPGTYRVEVHAPGFEAWKLSDIKVEGADVRTI